MKKLKLTKLIASTLVVASVLALTPIGASAEWRQDSTGWWYTESNSWATGWRNINGSWYYFYSDGYMAHDTTIEGYRLDSNGAWIITPPTASTTTTSSTTSNSTTENDNLTGEWDACLYRPDSTTNIKYLKVHWVISKKSNGKLKIINTTKGLDSNKEETGDYFIMELEGTYDKESKTFDAILLGIVMKEMEDLEFLRVVNY